MTRLRRRTPQVACQQLVELVTDYLEGELNAAHRTAVEQHLSVCGHCTGYVNQVRRLLELTADANPEPVPEALLEDLTVRFRGRH